MRRRSAVLCALVAALVLASASAAAQDTSWAQPQIKAVVGAGLMSRDIASFHPNDPLTRGALEELVAGLTQATPVVPSSPTATVTMAALDSRLVNALSLLDTAKLFQQAAKDA